MNASKPSEKKILSTLFSFLIGPADRFSLENRIFSTLMLTIVLLCLSAAVVNAMVGLPPATVVVMVLGTVFYSIYYYASRIKGYYSMHIWPSALVTLAILVVLWKYNGGSTGGAHYFLLIAPLLFILFIKRWQRVLFLFLYIAVTVGLLVVEYVHPSFVRGRLAPEAHFFDILASTIQTQLVIVFVVVWALRQYRNMVNRVEELRRKSENRFSEVANQIPVAICELDLDLRITYANRTAFDVSGYSPADLQQGLYLNRIVQPDSLLAIKEGVAMLLEGYSTPSREYGIITKTGEGKTVLGGSNLILTDGKPSGFRSSMIDITEMKHLEDRLRHAEKMESIGILAGGIAHDFNNVLTGILTSARMIKSDAGPTGKIEAGELEKTVDLIILAATRATELVRNLLVFSRQGHYQAIPFDCTAAVKEAVALLSHSLDKKIEIVQTYLKGSLVVKGDQSLVESAILNLAVNAQDAMPTGGILTITTGKKIPDAMFLAANPEMKKHAAFAAITVSDTGKGLDARVREHLFEPFVTSKEQGKGTGLGLASVYGTVKAFGGCIDVESEKGDGTTFTVYLPLTSDQVVQEAPPAASHTGGNGEAVMIVDDEEIILRAQERALAKQGYVVKPFSDPITAIEWYRDHFSEIACVILDIIMPRMNGKTCFERLRAINPGVRVIVTTGYTNDGDFQTFVKKSGALFVAKPFDACEMGRAIREAIGEARKSMTFHAETQRRRDEKL